jgi:c-di-GMP-binding flagellar brake protein YcgR
MTPSPRETRSNSAAHSLQACVRSIGYKEHRGQVTATHDDVATVDFPRGTAPYFPVAQEITITFRSREIFQPFVARSRVVLREDTEEHLRYKLRFSEQDAQTVSALFKRRASPRVMPDEEIGMSVCDAADADDGAFLSARVRDLSTSGCSFYIEPASEMQLCSARRLKIRFRLPGDAEKFNLLADVRYRKLVDHSVQYGVEFNWNADPRAPRVKERIDAFVQCRKREIMEHAMGPDWTASKR